MEQDECIDTAGYHVEVSSVSFENHFVVELIYEPGDMIDTDRLRVENVYRYQALLRKHMDDLAHVIV